MRRLHTRITVFTKKKWSAGILSATAEALKYQIDEKGNGLAKRYLASLALRGSNVLQLTENEGRNLLEEYRKQTPKEKNTFLGNIPKEVLERVDRELQKEVVVVRPTIGETTARVGLGGGDIVCTGVLEGELVSPSRMCRVCVARGRC